PSTELNSVTAIFRMRQFLSGTFSRSSEAQRRALPRLCRLDLTVLRRRDRLQRREQLLRDAGDLVHRALERRLVDLRRLREPADLPHVLKGSGADLVVRRGRVEVVERPDVPAHCVTTPFGPPPDSAPAG